MFRPTMALEGPVARSYFDGTRPRRSTVLLSRLYARIHRRGRGIRPSQGASAIHGGRSLDDRSIGAELGRASLAVVGWLALSRYKL